MLSGGGLFNNLDYSFFVGSENGKGEYNAPGGGSRALRKQLKILADFLHGCKLETLHPDHSLGVSSPGLIPYILSDPFGEYAIYLQATGSESSELQLETGSGDFLVQRLNTITGSYYEPELKTSMDGQLSDEDSEIFENYILRSL